MRSWSCRKLAVAAVLALVAALAAGVFVSGCGESLGEKAAEKAIEKAAEKSGQDIDVDIKDGSISVSGEGTDASYQYGGKVEVPKQIPASLISGDAEVFFAGKQDGEDGYETYAVQFYSKTDANEMAEFFARQVEKLGYEITGQYTAQQGEDSMVSVAGEKGETQIACTGGSKADGKYVYIVQIILGSPEGGN